MSLSASQLRKLASLNLSPEQMAGVLDVLLAVGEAEASRKAVERDRTRRYRERRALPGAEWAKITAQVKVRDGFECQYCGSKSLPLHVDHITPLSRGGTNDLTNLTTACVVCNCGKGGKTLEEWRRD